MTSGAIRTHTNRVAHGLRSRRAMLACTPSLLALIAASPADAHSAKRAQAKQEPQLAMAAVAAASALLRSPKARRRKLRRRTSPSSAPDQTNTAQAIVVTGIRGSLQRDLNAKRAAPGVMDVISAEDIGKFPDPNVADALQRMPGVSIQRVGRPRRGEWHHGSRLRRRLQRHAL